MAMAITGAFVGMTNAELTTLRTNTQNEINNLMKAGQSYSQAGRSHNRANLKDLTATLGEINHALQLDTGAKVTTTYANCGGEV
jgi:hypothetical protein